MYISSNTLSPVVENQCIVNIDGTVEIRMEPEDVAFIVKHQLLRCDRLRLYVLGTRILSDIAMPADWESRFTVEAIVADRWPRLTLVMGVRWPEEPVAA